MSTSRTGSPTEDPRGWAISTYSMLRNGASGWEIGLPGRTAAGLLPGKQEAQLKAEGKLNPVLAAVVAEAKQGLLDALNNS